MSYEIINASVLDAEPGDGFDSVLCDPPYGLFFMGKAWDHGVPGIEFWERILSWCKPGAHLMAFGGTRTQHRLTCAIEDAGWQIRDSLMWLYGCLSDDTEILIDGQWERYHKAIAGSLAMCYDPVRDLLSWQPVQELCEYDYNETAYRIHSEHTDQIVSRNHRCLVERDGAYSFALAEHVTQEREARVPVLEGVRSLLGDLPLPDKGTGHAEEDMRAGMQPRYVERAETECTDGKAERYMRGVREDLSPAPEPHRPSQRADVFEAVQRETARGRVGEARLQGFCGCDPGGPCGCNPQDDRPAQPGMEGRRNLLPQTRELQAGQVCEVSAGVLGDGAEGRLYNRTPPDRCSCDGTSVIEARDCSPRKSRFAEQRHHEPDAVQEQQGSQTVRGARYTRADLARVEPIHYTGKVWCVRVPTGAFVARRNGKVFVTGNSGFPKNLDISKAIDKAAGAEREIVGESEWSSAKMDAGKGVSGLRQSGSFAGEYSGERVNVPLTAPATPDAIRWDGYGTALKPSHEPVVLARKPLTAEQETAKLAHKIWRSLCQLRSFVKGAEKLSTSSQSGSDVVQCDSALWSAVERSSTPDALLALTDTWPSESDPPLSLSIGLSWLATLAGICDVASRYTTETASGLITDLKTLNSLASEITPDCIIRAATRQRGTGSSVDVVASTFSAARAKLGYILGRSAQDSVSTRTAATALRPDWRPITLARKPLDGTVARNCLEHGCGGINIDGGRVAGVVPQVTQGAEDRIYGGGKGLRSEPTQSKPHPSGRWPSNLILSHHHECVPVGTKRVKGDARQGGGSRPGGFGDVGSEAGGDQPCAPGHADADGYETVSAWRCHKDCPVNLLDQQSGERTSGNLNAGHKQGAGMMGKIGGDRILRDYGGDTGGASRFFKIIEHDEITKAKNEVLRMFYTAKASASERNAGLDCYLTVKYNPPNDGGAEWRDVITAAVQLLQRATSGSTVRWRTDESGESITALCRKASLSTTLTEINRIIESKTLNSLTLLRTSEYTPVVRSSTGSGGSPVENAARSKPSQLTTTNESLRVLARGARRVAHETLSRIRSADAWTPQPRNVNDGRKTSIDNPYQRGDTIRKNTHPTLKPIDLCRYLATLLLPPPRDTDRRILVPFSGSGSEMIGAHLAGWDHVVGIEIDAEYCEIAEARLKHWTRQGEMFAADGKAEQLVKQPTYEQGALL